MININELQNSIFAYLKKFIVENSKYNPTVLRNVVDKIYPLVVFETRSNTLESQTQDDYKLDKTRNLGFEINIFATPIGIDDSSIICDELANLTNYVMQEKFGMQGGLDATLKNINTDKATKYVLHYRCIWNIRQNIIY